MRVFKPTYSKPLPEGAKIVSRKNGNFVKYQDSRGHKTEARLTKSGDKILLETAHWHIEFADNQGIRRHLKAFTLERASKRLADKIEDLLSCSQKNRASASRGLITRSKQAHTASKSKLSRLATAIKRASKEPSSLFTTGKNF